MQQGVGVASPHGWSPTMSPLHPASRRTERVAPWDMLHLPASTAGGQGPRTKKLHGEGPREEPRWERAGGTRGGGGLLHPCHATRAASRGGFGGSLAVLPGRRTDGRRSYAGNGGTVASSAAALDKSTPRRRARKRRRQRHPRTTRAAACEGCEGL